ncbi:MAG TPA: tetraacyldisaccharide 4'-kinase [Chitinispirillaceae bacterium]|nr:tetraacyldisaccharide 4'-kinase [Chitinispirillaceae bacterium]
MYSHQSPLPAVIARTPVAPLLSCIYGTGVYFRNRWFDSVDSASIKVNRPVISIGGIRAGGTGKTPSAILVASLLSQLTYTPAILSRGYRRTSRSLRIVQPNEIVDWKEIGDEPSMIHNAIPESWMGIFHDRVTAAVELEKKIPEKAVFLLDDGFQHRRIRRDLDIVCLHEHTFDDKLIPRGFLREPVNALKRADVAFLIGDPQKNAALKVALEKKFSNLEIFELLYKPQGFVHAQSETLLNEFPYNTAVALSGIARPERFFSTLKQKGLNLQKELVFPDHYQFRKDDISHIQKLYSQELITTEKDAIRLLDNDVAPDANFWYLKMSLCFSPEDSLKRFNKLLKEFI